MFFKTCYLSWFQNENACGWGTDQGQHCRTPGCQGCLFPVENHQNLVLVDAQHIIIEHYIESIGQRLDIVDTSGSTGTGGVKKELEGWNSPEHQQPKGAAANVLQRKWPRESGSSPSSSKPMVEQGLFLQGQHHALQPNPSAPGTLWYSFCSRKIWHLH